jgi:antitoxin component YwqK of YwqJK toxin-antitoxin module
MDWSEGTIHGVVKTWYDNGQLQSERNFAHNQKTGASLAWYRDGSIMLVEEYENDRLMKGLYYRKNGLDAISSVVAGSGLATLYDEYGIFLRKVSYVKGEAVDPE